MNQSAKIQLQTLAFADAGLAEQDRTQVVAGLRERSDATIYGLSKVSLGVRKVSIILQERFGIGANPKSPPRIFYATSTPILF
jgi:hypothetical protein